MRATRCGVGVVVAAPSAAPSMGGRRARLMREMLNAISICCRPGALAEAAPRASSAPDFRDAVHALVRSADDPGSVDARLRPERLQ